MLKNFFRKVNQWLCRNISNNHKLSSGTTTIIKHEVKHKHAEYRFQKRNVELSPIKRPIYFVDTSIIEKCIYDVHHLTVRCNHCGEVFKITRYSQMNALIEIPVTSKPPVGGISANQMMCHKHDEPLVNYDCFFPYHSEGNQCAVCIHEQGNKINE